MAFTTYRLDGARVVGSVPSTGIEPTSHSIVINRAGVGINSYVTSFSIANGVAEWIKYYVQDHSIKLSQHTPPIFDGFGGFYLDDQKGTGLHHFTSATGAYNGKHAVVIASGSDWRAIGTTKKVGSTTYLAVLRKNTMASFTHDGATLSLVARNTSGLMSNSIQVRSITLKPNSRIYSLGPPGIFSGTRSLRHCAWGSSGSATVIDIDATYGFPESDAVELFYHATDDSLLICHRNGIVKVDADSPTTVIGTLSVAIADGVFPTYNSANGIQADDLFMVNSAYNYKIINATTLAIVDTYDGRTFDYGLVGQHATTYLYPEEAIFRRDATPAGNDTITYIREPTPPPVDPDSIATLSKSIGQFTLASAVITASPCPISGRGNDVTISGYSSVPPGIGQVICGRDDVQLACDG